MVHSDVDLVEFPKHLFAPVDKNLSGERTVFCFKNRLLKMPVSLICVKVVDLVKPNLGLGEGALCSVRDLKNEALLPAPDGDSYAAQCRYASVPKRGSFVGAKSAPCTKRNAVFAKHFQCSFPEFLSLATSSAPKNNKNDNIHVQSLLWYVVYSVKFSFGE